MYRASFFMDEFKLSDYSTPKQKFSRSQKLYVFALLVALPCLVSNSTFFRIIGAILLFWALIYNMVQTKHLKEDVEDKNKKTNIRLVDGIKSLTGLMEVAYDHIKDHTYRMNKTDGIIRKHTTELHQLSRTKHRLVERRIEIKENLPEKTRIEWQAKPRESRINKTETVGPSVSNDVPNVEHSP